MVSIVVPCFNQAHWLPEALASVLAQSYTDWECIVVDDGSTDETSPVAAGWQRRDPRFRQVQQANKGLAAARNAGIAAAKGSFILPLDADDKISLHYLTSALLAFDSDPALQVVYGQAEYFGEKQGRWNLPVYGWPGILLENAIYCSALYRKTDWERVGGYNEAIRDGLEDWDFWISILDANSRVLQLPEVVFYYRQRQGSMFANLFTGQEEKLQAAFARVYCRHYPKYATAFGDPYQNIHELARLRADKKSWQASFRYNIGRSWLPQKWKKSRN